MSSSQSTIMSSITSTPRRSPSFASLSKPKTLALDKGQLTLFGNAILINTNNACHITIANFIHSNALPFSLSECPKLLKIIKVSRNLEPGYIPPDHGSVSGNLLNSLFNTRFADVMKTLLLEADIFQISIFCDAAMIKSVPLINVLAAVPNNPFALLGASKSFLTK